MNMFPFLILASRILIPSLNMPAIKAHLAKLEIELKPHECLCLQNIDELVMKLLKLIFSSSSSRSDSWAHKDSFSITLSNGSISGSIIEDLSLTKGVRGSSSFGLELFLVRRRYQLIGRTKGLELDLSLKSTEFQTLVMEMTFDFSCLIFAMSSLNFLNSDSSSESILDCSQELI